MSKLSELSLVELKQSRATVLDRLQELNKEPDGIGDDARRIIVNGFEAELQDLRTEIDKREGREREDKAAVRNGNGQLIYGDNGPIETTSAILAPNQSFRSYMQANGLIRQPEFERLSFGAFIRAAVVGPRSDLERRALAEGTDSAGGFTVPDATLAQFIDALRSATIVVRAGARTVPLTTDHTTIARTATDPTAAWRVENAAITVSDSTYEGVVFIPRSLAVIVKVSRELLEDSLNIESMLQASFAGSMAVEIDRVALVGSGVAPQPTGISNTTNVGSVAAGGALASYDKIIDALYELWIDNEQTVSAIVMAPRSLLALSKLVTGITSDKTPLQKPPVLDGIPILQTTSIPVNLGGGSNESLIILGNFSRLMLGIRSALRVEVLRELYAGDHQYGFVAHLRMDVAVEHPESFAQITGITA